LRSEINDNIRVTVVIPAYNAAEFIRDAVTSCFSQTHRPMETIVVNDGSTDATSNKVGDLSEKISRNDFELKLIDIGRNMGAANALNVGFSNAKGAYVCWLSADDIFIDREKIEKQIEFMRRTGADWSYFRDFYSGANTSTARLVKGSYLPHLRILNPLFVHDSDLRLALLLFRNPINGSSVMIEKECVETYGQFDPVTRNVDADGDLWMRYSALGLKLVSVKGAPVFYREHSMQTSKKKLDMLYGCELTRVRILATLEKKGSLTRLAKKIAPFLPILVKTNQHIGRPFASQYLFNHILDHKKEFDRVFLKYIQKAQTDVSKQLKNLKIDTKKFAEDTEAFEQSPSFKNFEKLYI
jgi:glycosyltransferase involved in cell wall biosynthesis